jgi:predicted phage terminase large subunit-like protein
MLQTQESQTEMLARVAQNWRLTPATLGHYVTRGTWIAAPWLQYASIRVAAGIKRGGARIIISAPPRHGKTELVSVNTATWVLETMPKKNIILTGYGSDLVEASARKVRDRFMDDESLLKVRVPRSTSQVAAFQTDHEGYMFSVGLGGAITGRGAHVLIIDDYIKEIKEALSPAHRDYVWNWFVTTAMTRLEPGASVIIIATRWHSDDLIGRIIKNLPGQWENIVFPAICTEQNDLERIIHRKTGEALFPERFSVADLEANKELLGTIFFNALYQQRPVDETQKISDAAWLKEVEEKDITSLARDFRWIRVWDLASTEGGGDYTVGTLVGYSPSTHICLIGNVVRDQLGPKDIEDKVRLTAVNGDGIETKVGIEQEPGSSGKNLVNHYATNVLPEFNVEAIPTASTAKLIRGQPFLAAAEAGKVYLVKASWNQTFAREFGEGYAGQFDDQLDTAAAGYNYLSGKKAFSATFGRRKAHSNQNSKQIRKASFSLGTGASTKIATFGRRRTHA